MAEFAQLGQAATNPGVEAGERKIQEFRRKNGFAGGVLRPVRLLARGRIPGCSNVL